MITLILTVALVGFITWLIITYIPMPDIFKNVIVVLVVIILILYIFSTLGFHDIAVRH